MKKDSFLINVKDIQSLRITCSSCKTAVIIPLTLKNAPSHCVGCGVPITPNSLIIQLMQQLNQLNEPNPNYVIQNNKHSIEFLLSLEGEES